MSVHTCTFREDEVLDVGKRQQYGNSGSNRGGSDQSSALENPLSSLFHLPEYRWLVFSDCFCCCWSMLRSSSRLLSTYNSAHLYVYTMYMNATTKLTKFRSSFLFLYRNRNWTKQSFFGFVLLVWFVFLSARITHIEWMQNKIRWPSQSTPNTFSFKILLIAV